MERVDMNGINIGPARVGVLYTVSMRLLMRAIIRSKNARPLASSLLVRGCTVNR